MKQIEVNKISGAVLYYPNGGAMATDDTLAVTVTEEMEELLSGSYPCIWDFGSETLIQDIPELSKAQETQKAKIAASRYDAEFGGFTDEASGMFCRTDERTRSLLTAAKVRATEDETYTVSNWKTSEGTFITLSNATIIALESAMHDFIEAQFAKEAALCVQIDSATTNEEVEAISW
ncbi:DUF4376 domain-containing protein [Tichowtungia aerotolerans]|uniref:DUF4376 domain-containing protein n=1 Tax=Tichowtungia aerotolerans TaxID=2697043 RepID=A0A6P1MBJ9_9BACT|nr:DUF4376 domain-containing protein [Tichowtungia aerotolerans]QHI70473.1 DUF4376 domain-containing protein [Tichowtungia aerotolerans]